MPIYEYACKECGHTLDALQKVADAPLVECPDCGKPALRRLISAPRFRLKGEGWYETDFKKENRRNVLSTDSEAPKKEKSESKDSGKTEKPDVKTGTAAKTKASPAIAGKEKKADTG
ncbi:MAG TPA: zinc ribbon domain-containing protein [Woeseiaceae bacterium]|nr:zinc ribbon domain-containing protein [Woeseiaceae bacterium]